MPWYMFLEHFILTWFQINNLFLNNIWVILFVEIDDSLKVRLTTLPSLVFLEMSLIISWISFVLIGWNDCIFLNVKSLFMHIFQMCCKARPYITPMLQFLVSILNVSEDGRYWNTWSWVFKNSLAIVGEDATTMMEPIRRCIRGPCLSAQCVSVRCGCSPTIQQITHDRPWPWT